MRAPRTLKVAAVVLATALVAACGGSGSESSSDQDSLKIAWHIPPSSMDPHRTTSASGSHPYISMLYDRLTALEQVDGQPQVVPSIATAWETTPDGLTTTFTIRDDVTFHDGTPLDANAVALSIERGVAPDTMSARYFEMIDGVSAPAPHTVVFTLKHPSSDLPFLLSTSLGSIINPKSINDDLSQKADGSGPYELTRIVPGDRVVYSHIDGYWNDETYVIPEVEIIGMVDDNSRMNAVRSGQIDAAKIRVAQYEEASDAAAGGDFELTNLDNLIWYNVNLNHDRGPLKDPRVRQALNYAIDRDAINTSLLNGQCVPTSQPLQEAAEGHRTDVDYTYDPDKARELLAEAGYPDGFALDGVTSGDISKIGITIQAALADIGVDINFRNSDFNDMLAQWTAGNADAVLFAANATSDAGFTLKDRYLGTSQKGPLPEGFEDSLSQALTLESGDPARTEILSALSGLASEQATEIFICAPANPYLHSSNVAGFDTMASQFAGGPFDLRGVHFQ
ncbi:ABC transporter substrate-binding protein [Rhodococcus artemisiae]|uniref:ABC transporter substrate-binding protein n=1 Tax=Rhodococcus artemisiae TaxID=714159 RepID=A0ABU7LC66_9NOCA|nr:ABC transporter substrate-binding protein [Rhodococcus artemisiae]MEE2059146.1 ABC transporter substrate-binding protein [Rhodococcus artemisiae]